MTHPRTTHGGAIPARTARTGGRTGRRAVALPYQTVSSGFLPVSPRVWIPSLRGATSPAASVAGLFQPGSGQRIGVVPSAACFSTAFAPGTQSAALDLHRRAA